MFDFIVQFFGGFLDVWDMWLSQKLDELLIATLNTFYTVSDNDFKSFQFIYVLSLNIKPIAKLKII